MDNKTNPQKSLLISLALANAIATTGFGIIFPIFPQLLADVGGGNALDLGTMAAAFGFAYFIASPIFGNLADYYNKSCNFTNPDNISKAVLSKGLDSGTAYAILSIDIADVDVGRNIGAHLEADQAEADKMVAQAQAAIESEKKAAIADLKNQVASLSLDIAEKVVKENLSSDDKQQKLVKNLLEDSSLNY